MVTGLPPVGPILYRGRAGVVRSLAWSWKGVRILRAPFLICQELRWIEDVLVGARVTVIVPS